MATIDLFSKRRKRELTAGKAEVYRYDVLPHELRVQIAHISMEALGSSGNYFMLSAPDPWHAIHNMMAREKGVFFLSDPSNRNESKPREGTFDARCINWTIGSSLEDALDMIELIFRYIDEIARQWPRGMYQQCGVQVGADQAIGELNDRFKEHSVGYQFEGGRLIRVDNQYIHAEIVKPVLSLISIPSFEKANEEFLLAHQHYREGKFQDSIVAAQRAFESTLKAICAQRGWQYNKGDRAPELIKVVRANQLFPEYLDSGFDTYIAMLKTGLPNVRNNAGGHGHAPDSQPVPSYLAAYALHLTAANIIMTVEASNSYKKKGRR
jgi:AbiJ N-terminal domain 4/HEPN domain